MGHLNSVMEYCHDDRSFSNEIYRTETSMLDAYDGHMKRMKNDAARVWKDIPRSLYGNFTKWDVVDILLIPVFVGPRACGHWTMLVCDRRVHKAGIFTWFDSLPSYTIHFLTVEQLKQKF